MVVGLVGDDDAVALALLLGKEDDAGVFLRALDDIRRCYEKGENLMEAIVRASNYRISVGEINETLKAVHGQWNPPLFT